MDQIANLVIDLGIDAAEFKNEIPRIKNLLNGAASDAERSSARMQRFMERQTQAARQTMQAASSAATAASVHAQTVEKSAQAHERMAREVEQTRQRMEALSQKMREEQAQAMALAEARDKAAAAFCGVAGITAYSAADPTGQKQWRDWSAGLSGADF